MSSGVSSGVFSRCTPLHLAARSGDRRTLRLLLEHRAHVNARDGRGHTALRHAARALQPRAVHELLRSDYALITL